MAPRKTTTFGNKSAKDMATGKSGKKDLTDRTLDSILKYSNLIKAIPIDKQSARLEKKTWEGRLGKLFQEMGFLFPENEKKIVISREDVLKEEDCRRKIVKTLAWGFPTGGRGNHIKKIFGKQKLDYLEGIFMGKQGKTFSQEELKGFIGEIEKVEGLGESTWSKLLYFFRIKVDSKRCQIFDDKIKDSLNNTQFCELKKYKEERGISTWKKDISNYFLFMDLLTKLSDIIGFERGEKYKLEKIENFLFHYNLGFKFLSDMCRQE